MSDLQDIIVSSSVKAFNSGLAHGVIQERERILEAVEQWRKDLLEEEPYSDEELAQSRDEGYARNFEFLIDLIKGEQK